MIVIDIPEADCNCRWDAKGEQQTAICPGHKALMFLHEFAVSVLYTPGDGEDDLARLKELSDQ